MKAASILRFCFVAAFAAMLAASSAGCGKFVPADSMKLRSKRTVALGTFDVTTPKLIVADPGYDLDTAKTSGLGAVLENCKPGTWQAQVVVKEFNEPGFSLASELRVWNTNITDAALLKWEKQKGGVGVDSGQAGVYDAGHFHDPRLVPTNMNWTVGRPGPADPQDLWYSFCCEVSMGKLEGGVIPFGVVTNSGMGDGGYEYFISRDPSGAIVGVWIVFVDDSGRG